MLIDNGREAGAAVNGVKTEPAAEVEMASVRGDLLSTVPAVVSICCNEKSAEKQHSVKSPSDGDAPDSQMPPVQVFRRKSTHQA